MSLLDRAKADLLQFTTKTADFGQAMTITTEDGMTTANVVGFHNKTHISYDINREASE